MLSIILKLLTIIGITILILLGMVLFLMLVVLFIPITYMIKGQVTAEDKNASIRMKWLFGIVRFSFDYRGKVEYCLNVLWWNITGILNSKPKKTIKHKADSSQERTAISEATDADETPNETEHEESIENPKEVIDVIKESDEDAEDSGNIIFKIRNIYDKIMNIRENISYYIQLLNEDDTKHLLSHCLKVIGKILKSIRPRKLVLNLNFGFDEPDTTGKVYGLLCMLYPFYGKDIYIEPDFEQKILIGDVYCKGRILVFTLLLNALRILLDKKLYKVIHKLKNGGKENGK